MNYYDETRSGRVRRALEAEVLQWEGVTRSTEFGCPSYRVNGSLFAIVSDQGVSATALSEPDRQAYTRRLSAGPFRAGSRVVDAWLTVPVEDDDVAAALSAVRQSYRRAAAGDLDPDTAADDD
jgi:hypothetical protein